MSSIWVLGSGECDQLGLGPDVPTAERPKKLITLKVPVKLSKIVCGGLHTLALTNEGQVYSWGCNDDGALGRSGTESNPELVDKLPIAVSDIAAGDSHSIGCNKDLGVIYLWGRYRNVKHGNFMDIIKNPLRVGEFEFRRKKIQKVVSGAHHTLFLAGGQVSAVGEPENENLGRLVLDRHKKEKSLGLRIERAHYDKTKYKDIFAGNYHSFAVTESGELYAWGLNNYGQLGVGDYKNTRIMKQVQVIPNGQVVSIVGGENHTVALTVNGEVYTWGKNDESQLGYTLEDEEMKDNEEEKKEEVKIEETKNKEEVKSELVKPEQMNTEPINKDQVNTEQVKGDNVNKKPTTDTKVSTEEIKEDKVSNDKAEKVKKNKNEKVESMKVDTEVVAKTPEELAAQLGDQGDPTNCSPIPRKLEGLTNIKKISSGTHYTYAISQEPALYSW